MPEVREKLVTMGVEVVGGTPEDFALYLKSEIDKWTAVIQAAQVKIE
jgi:tripartite-type tricarboxylate transporter receptor subunit TctC